MDDLREYLFHYSADVVSVGRYILVFGDFGAVGKLSAWRQRTPGVSLVCYQSILDGSEDSYPREMAAWMACVATRASQGSDQTGPLGAEEYLLDEAVNRLSLESLRKAMSAPSLVPPVSRVAWKSVRPSINGLNDMVGGIVVITDCHRFNEGIVVGRPGASLRLTRGMRVLDASVKAVINSPSKVSLGRVWNVRSGVQKSFVDYLVRGASIAEGLGGRVFRFDGDGLLVHFSDPRVELGVLCSVMQQQADGYMSSVVSVRWDGQWSNVDKKLGVMQKACKVGLDWDLHWADCMHEGRHIAADRMTALKDLLDSNEWAVLNDSVIG